MKRKNQTPKRSASQVEDGDAGGVERQMRVVASTFANMELVSTQQAYEASNKLLKSAEDECERLRGLIEMRDRDSLEVVNFLQNDNAEKSRRIGVLEQELKAVDLKSLKREELSRKRFEEVLNEKEVCLQRLKSEVERLNKELVSVGDYQRERFEMARNLEQHRQGELQLVEEYEQKLSRLKFATVEERVRLRSLEEEMRSAFQAQVQERAGALAKLKNGHVHTVNERLQHANDILSQEITSLVSLAGKYQTNASSLQREMKVSDDLHDDALRHTARLKSKVRALTAQRSKMEEDRRTLIKTSQVKTESQMSTAQHMITSLQQQLKESQSLTRLQQKEIRRLKELSGLVLDQRGELEQFFYKAISFTKLKEAQSEGCFLTQPSNFVTVPTPPLREPLNSKRLPRLLGSARSNFSSRGGSGGTLSGSMVSPRSAVVTPPVRPPAPIQLPSAQLDGVVSARGIPVRRNVMSADARVEVDMRVRNTATMRHINGGAMPTQLKEPPMSAHSQAPPPTIETAQDLTRDHLATSEPFSDMPWCEKELVIKALLSFMNQQFHQKKQHSAKELVDEIVEWNSTGVGRSPEDLEREKSSPIPSSQSPPMAPDPDTV